MTTPIINVQLTKAESGLFSWLEAVDPAIDLMQAVTRISRTVNAQRTFATSFYQSMCSDVIYEVSTNLETKRSWISRKYQEVK